MLNGSVGRLFGRPRRAHPLADTPGSRRTAPYDVIFSVPIPRIRDTDGARKEKKFARVARTTTLARRKNRLPDHQTTRRLSPNFPAAQGVNPKNEIRSNRERNRYGSPLGQLAGPIAPCLACGAQPPSAFDRQEKRGLNCQRTRTPRLRALTVEKASGGGCNIPRLLLSYQLPCYPNVQQGSIVAAYPQAAAPPGLGAFAGHACAL